MRYFRALLRIATVLAMLAGMWGCGGGGDGTTATSVFLIASPSYDYYIQGNNLNNVARMELSLSFLTSGHYSYPSVTKGDLIAGANMTYTYNSGIVNVTVVCPNPVSGNGKIALLGIGDAGILYPSPYTLNSVKLYDINGNLIQISQ